MLYNQTVKTLKDYAVGIIPLHREGDADLFCLIQDSKGYWGFPKGHVDPGEQHEQAARRELEEEAGISEVKLDASRMFTERYIVTGKGKEWDKTVTYFLGYVADRQNQTSVAFKKEIPDMRWFTYSEAKETIRPQSRALLEEVQTYLESMR